MSIYRYRDYRQFLKSWLEAQPKKGYGLSSKIAAHLGVNTAFISQVFNGSKSFNSEQALGAAEYVGLGEKETEYFLLLVQLDRAGTVKLKKFLAKRIDEVRKAGEDLAKKFASDVQMTDAQRAVFYSDWSYSAVRQTTALPGKDSAEAIAASLDLAPEKVAEVLGFLVEQGFCIHSGGRYSIGARRTHLEASSPFVGFLHQNWRSKAIDKLRDKWEPKIHFTSPMTLRPKDAIKVRQILLDAIEKAGAIVDESEPEELVCLNIDWFRVDRD